MHTCAKTFQAQVSLKQCLCSSPLRQASHKQLTVIFSTGQAFNAQAARPDKPASRFAEFLQTQAGKQQITAGTGSVISLPLWVSLMGLSRYGRQLFVRPSYLQLKHRILQLHQASDTYVDKMMIISGTPGIGKSFCALYMACYWIAKGTRVIYEFHDQDEAASVSWYHFPPNSGEGFCVDLQQDVSHHVRGATDGNTVYIVDGGLPRIPASSCWCYAFSSPQKSVYRYERKVPSCHLMFLPLWTLEELQQCRGSVDIFSSTVTAELAELAFEFAGGVPRTVLQLPAQTANASIPTRSLIVDQLETAVNMLPSEVIRCSLLLLRQLVLPTAVLVNHNSLSTLTCVLSCCLAVWHNKPWVEVVLISCSLNPSCCSCIFNSNVVWLCSFVDMIVWLSHVAGSARHCEPDPHSGVPQWQRLTLSHVVSWPA